MTSQSLDHWFAEGLRQQQVGRYTSAVLAWKRVLALDPLQTDAWCNLGACFRELKRLDDAEAALRRCLELDPGHLAARCNLGIVAMDRGNPAEALTLFDEVLAEDPGFGPARFHRGSVLAELGHWEEGRQAALAVAEEQPDSWPAQVNAGWHLLKAGRLDEAEAAFERALAQDPDLPAARWNRFWVRFLQGRWREAWPDFPARFEVREGLSNRKTFSQPAWGGEPFEGRTLLLWCEQGFGDTIQFLRFLPEVQALGGSVVVQVQPALVSLVASSWNVPVVSEADPLPAFDLQAPLMDLGRLLAVEPEGLVDRVPYLVPPPLSSDLAVELRGSGLRIGLAWTGNPAHRDQARRSIPTAAFAALAEIPGVTWCSLQRLAPGALSDPLPAALRAVDLSPHFVTFRETAAAVAAMDLVITADTVIAHLAGALGVPTFLLLSTMPDWRWGITGETTPWYPTVRIYRQTELDDWASVVARVVQDLRGASSWNC